MSHIANDNLHPNVIDYFRLFHAEESEEQRANGAEAEARAFLKKWGSALLGKDKGAFESALRAAKRLSFGAARWISCHGKAELRENGE